jgi:hypothetical protein
MSHFLKNIIKKQSSPKNKIKQSGLGAKKLNELH